jgi:hypothetical protein
MGATQMKKYGRVLDKLAGFQKLEFSKLSFGSLTIV